MPEISRALYRAGEGEPLVLVHGFTATWKCWKPVLADLVPRFDVFAPTLHGHDGGPSLPEDRVAHTIAEAANHLETLLDEQGIETAHFAGNSMGGALSLELAKRGRARSVVAISPGGGWEESDKLEPERIIKWFTRNQALTKRTQKHLERTMRRPGLRRLALRDVRTRGDQVPRDDAVELALSSINCSVVDDVFDTIRNGHARVTGLEAISCPVLLAWGTKDRVLPLEKHSAYFRRSIRGVEWKPMPGVGHTPMWDDPNGIASLIADFATRYRRSDARAEAQTVPSPQPA